MHKRNLTQLCLHEFLKHIWKILLIDSHSSFHALCFIKLIPSPSILLSLLFGICSLSYFVIQTTSVFLYSLPLFLYTGTTVRSWWAMGGVVSSAGQWVTSRVVRQLTTGWRMRWWTAALAAPFASPSQSDGITAGTAGSCSVKSKKTTAAFSPFQHCHFYMSFAIERPWWWVTVPMFTQQCFKCQNTKGIWGLMFQRLYETANEYICWT